MGMDAMSQALAMRRGRNLPHGLGIMGDEHQEPAGEATSGKVEHSPEAKHLAGEKKTDEAAERVARTAPSDPSIASKTEPGYEDKDGPHVEPEAIDAPMQGDDSRAAEAMAEMAEAVGDHASKEQYEDLKGIKPRSLGERAKMDALKKKYG